jgi:glycosyltransferase involved in cell wall biosynthesis
MRVLYLSQYFPPEVGATQTRAYEMAQGLVRAGHEVTMITEMPNHPIGIIPPEYKGKLFEQTTLNGINVLRVWVKTTPEKTFITRMAFYLSYMVMAIIAGLFRARGKYDVIYVTSPPLFVGGAGLVLSFLRRTPMVFEVRDLWPESAVVLGELKNTRVIKLSTWLEEACYRRALRIIAVTKGIKDRLIERGFPDSKIALIPNGANTELYKPQPINLALRRQLNIPGDKFVVIYAGLHGLAHGLETLLQTANLLHDDPNIFFLLLGQGPRKVALIELADDLDLPNVMFHDAVPEANLPNYITIANLGLDTRRKVSISGGTLPVKMFSYMACEVPVVLSIEGEATQLLAKAQAGIAVDPENPEALARAIIELKENPGICKMYGQNGRAFVEQEFSRQKFAEYLGQILEETIS